ncbi:MAG TPA: DUF3108 domain-containing protein [Cytophagaceae bacterium]|jgi:hypothetical protein|nr:DUF3108 domain-containing protein [Cytophagaceae bacterium]
MKNYLRFIIPVMLFVTFGFTFREQGNVYDKNVFGCGEKLEFRVHYGFINAGEATIQIYPQMYKVNNLVCYKAEVSGRSVGAFDLALRIRDEWVTYMDTSTTSPQKFYRDVEEGKYRLKEFVHYDYAKDVATVDREGKNGKDKSRKEYAITKDVQDIVSGFYFLRTINFNKMKVGDTIRTIAFFEDKTYDFRIRFLGKGIIDTKFGEISAIKLSPIMPDNKLFEGGSSIRMWISDDKNKIPVKIEADMFVGAVEMDLKSYRGLRYPITFKD